MITTIRKFAGLSFLLTAVAVLAGCGGGDDAFTGSSSSSSSSGGSAGADVASLSVVSNVNTIAADGSESATITAYARDASNGLLSGVAVRFSVDSGGVTPSVSNTDSSCAATTTLITAGDATPRNITVTATVGSLVKTVVVSVSTSSGSGSTTGTPSSLSLVASATTMLPTDSPTITAYVRDSNNALLSSIPVSFTTSRGGVSPSSVTTNANGAAATTLTAAGDTLTAGDTVTVTASTATGLHATVQVTVVTATGGTSSTVASLTLVSAVSSIPVDGSQTAAVTAYVRNSSNALISGIPITFSTTKGGVAPASATSNSNGSAQTVLSIAGDPSVMAGDTLTVTASAGGLTATAQVQVASTSSGTSTQKMGSGSGSSFQQGVLALSSSSISAGGSTTVQAYLVNADGSLYTNSATVTFNSSCVAQNKAEFQDNGAVTASKATSTGIAALTYVAKGCVGADVITATATVNGQNLSATGTVTVAAATVGSISFVSVTPSKIALKGTGNTTLPETSTVLFRVFDSANGAVSGATVSFSLNTSVGNIVLSQISATSDADGYVRTVVSSGTVATTVRVTATVTGGSNISTQSSQLTITTGIPTANNFSLSEGCYNIEGWEYDGTSTSVTARLSDRFQNPVPDGTAVTFTAEGGKIDGQCTTTTSSSESGFCSVNYTSQEYRPTDGRVSLLASAIGEESFLDANGDGKFTTGTDIFNTSGSPLHDLAEPFRDDNEDGSYTAGEYFVDFNSNGTHDAANGLFDGALCTGASCGNPSTAIGRQGLIILSGSNPTVTQTAGPSSLSQNDAQLFSFWIRDLHGNVLPGGTSVALAAANAGLGVATPASFSIPCATPAANTQVSGATLFSFTVTSGSSTGSGILTLTITTPKGRITTVQIPVAVN